MSAAAIKSIENANVRQVKPGELFVSGKINSVDKFQLKNKETRYRTRILMKDSTDDFSYPMPVDVVAEQPLGAVGELFSGVVQIKTYRGDYVTKPNEDGEVKKIKEVKLACYFAG